MARRCPGNHRVGVFCDRLLLRAIGIVSAVGPADRPRPGHRPAGCRRRSLRALRDRRAWLDQPFRGPGEGWGGVQDAGMVEGGSSEP